VKAQTKIRIGIVTALVLFILFISLYIGSWGGRPFDITIIFLFIYAFALITRKLNIAKGMFTLWSFFNLLNIYRLTLDLIESPKKELGLYIITVFFTGLIIFLLGIGISGLRRIVEEENELIESKIMEGKLINPANPKVSKNNN